MALEGQVAIVTGGASGIGRGTAERLAQEGAAVVIADIDREAAAAAAGEIGRGVLAVETDVSDPDQVGRLVRAALEAHGRIDILVNVAGICPVIGGEDTGLEDWNRVLAVNVTGMFLCTKAVVPVMQEQQYGRIVYTSSTAAEVGSLVAHVGYGVSKAGGIALMKSVAKGFAGDGITANAVSPATTDTPLTASFDEKTRAAFVANSLLKRVAAASEVADAIFFLVSEQSTYITGHVLNVDAGFALR